MSATTSRVVLGAMVGSKQGEAIIGSHQRTFSKKEEAKVIEVMLVLLIKIHEVIVEKNQAKEDERFVRQVAEDRSK